MLTKVPFIVAAVVVALSFYFSSILGILLLALLLVWFVLRIGDPDKLLDNIALAITVEVSVIVATIFYNRWTGNPDLVARSRFLVLFDRQWWHLASVAFVSGVLSATGAVLLAFLGGLYVGAQFILHMPEGLGLKPWDAMMYLLDLVLKRAKRSVTVDKGEAKYGAETHQTGVGTGLIVIKPGNAVVLKSMGDGGKERVLGPGESPLQNYEHIIKIVDLTKRTIKKSFRGVLTRDQIGLRFEVILSYQVASKADVDDITGYLKPGPAIPGDYKAYEQTIRDVAYKTPEDSVEGAVVSACIVALRNVVGRIGLFKLLNLDRSLYRDNPASQMLRDIDRELSAVIENEFREEVAQYLSTAHDGGFLLELLRPSYLDQLGNDVKRELAKETMKWGVAIREVNVLTVHMPKDVRQRMLDLWLKKRETELAREGMKSESEVLAMWRTGVVDALKIESDTRRTSIEGILELLRKEGIDVKSPAVAQKIVDFMTKETSVVTSPGLRGLARKAEKKDTSQKAKQDTNPGDESEPGPENAPGPGDDEFSTGDGIDVVDDISDWVGEEREGEPE